MESEIKDDYQKELEYFIARQLKRLDTFFDNDDKPAHDKKIYISTKEKRKKRNHLLKIFQNYHENMGCTKITLHRTQKNDIFTDDFQSYLYLKDYNYLALCDTIDIMPDFELEDYGDIGTFKESGGNYDYFNYGLMNEDLD